MAKTKKIKKKGSTATEKERLETLKKDKDSQQEGWENRLAFLSGINQTIEERSSFIEPLDNDDNDPLIPPLQQQPKFVQRFSKRVQRHTAKIKQRQRRERAPEKRQPPKTSPEAEARKRVKKRVREIQNEILKENMPKVALQLYREGRELLNLVEPANNNSDDFYEATCYVEAAVDAFREVDRYKDAADVLLFLAKWIITNISERMPVNLMVALIEEARSYIDPQVDHALLKRCDDLGIALMASKAK